MSPPANASSARCRTWRSAARAHKVDPPTSVVAHDGMTAASATAAGTETTVAHTATADRGATATTGANVSIGPSAANVSSAVTDPSAATGLNVALADHATTAATHRAVADRVAMIVVTTVAMTAEATVASGPEQVPVRRRAADLVATTTGLLVPSRPADTHRGAPVADRARATTAAVATVRVFPIG